MQHKYLNDIGIQSDDVCIFNTSDRNDDRQERFDAQRKEFGFDERETWSLDYTIAGWLYSHLKMYEDIGGQVVNMSFHRFEIPVLKEIPKENRTYPENANYPESYYKEVPEEHTQLGAIHIMEEYLESYVKHAFCNSVEEELRAYEKAKCAFRIFAEVFPAMWW